MSYHSSHMSYSFYQDFPISLGPFTNQPTCQLANHHWYHWVIQVFPIKKLHCAAQWILSVVRVWKTYLPLQKQMGWPRFSCHLPKTSGVFQASLLCTPLLLVLHDDVPSKKNWPDGNLHKQAAEVTRKICRFLWPWCFLLNKNGHLVGVGVLVEGF